MKGRGYKTMATDKLNTLEKQNMILFLENKRLRKALEEIMDGIEHSKLDRLGIWGIAEKALEEKDEQ